MKRLTEARIQPHNERAAGVWNMGGGAYDEISRGISDSIEHCLNRLEARAGERVLDVATGTGWTARRLAKRGAKVVGIDLGADLIEAARLLSEREGLDIDFQVGDAESLPFDDGAFDAVVSTCGVMFANRPEAAAAELARVCRPGGRLALTSWSPDGAVFRMFMVMKAYMQPPPDPAPPSPFEWGRIERVEQLLGQDFDLRFERGTSFYREPGGEAAWNTFSTGYGPTRTLAGSLDGERLEALRRDFIAFHEQFRDELGITVPRSYLVTLGVRRTG